MRPRFYLPSIAADGHGVLDDDESGHLTRVLRLGAGAEIDVFDGRGGMFQARVVEAGRGVARVQVLGPVPAAPEPRVRVTLVMSVLKADKMDEVVRDAAMMGAFAVEPVFSDHGDVNMDGVTRGRRWERWQRIAVSSVKQCGRAVVPAVRAPCPLTAWLSRGTPDTVLVLTEPRAGTGTGLSQVSARPSVQLLVGPEGGWSADESAAFATAGFHAIALGARTLRADSVPLVALAAIYEAWNAW